MSRGHMVVHVPGGTLSPQAFLSYARRLGWGLAPTAAAMGLQEYDLKDMEEESQVMHLFVDDMNTDRVRLHVGGQKSGVTVTQTATGINFDGRVTQ